MRLLRLFVSVSSETSHFPAAVARTLLRLLAKALLAVTFTLSCLATVHHSTFTSVADPGIHWYLSEDSSQQVLKLYQFLRCAKQVTVEDVPKESTHRRRTFARFVGRLHSSATDFKFSNVVSTAASCSYKRSNSSVNLIFPAVNSYNASLFDAKRSRGVLYLASARSSLLVLTSQGLTSEKQLLALPLFSFLTRLLPRAIFPASMILR